MSKAFTEIRRKNMKINDIKDIKKANQRLLNLILNEEISDSQARLVISCLTLQKDILKTCDYEDRINELEALLEQIRGEEYGE